MKSYIIVATASGFSFVSFTAEEIMSVVHFKTVISAVIGTNIQVFFFWQELFVPAIALASVFFLLVKDERKYLFYRLFETYLSNTDGAKQKSMTAKGRVECSSFLPNFRLNSMTSRKHRQATLKKDFIRIESSLKAETSVIT